MPISARAFVRSQAIFLAVGFLALAAIVVVALWLGERSSRLGDEILAARDLKAAVVELSASVQRAESSQRGFLYTGNEIYLAPYDLAKTEAERAIKALPARLTTYPQLGAATAKLGETIHAKFEEMEGSIALARDRKAEAALDSVLTNRGKALMDEANIYISGISTAADDRLATLAAEQATNAGLQRLVAITGALVAIAAAAAALVTILQYAKELATARDALTTANTQLENKVAVRTADLAKRTEEMTVAKERAEMLMHEVNHRVANSLAVVSALVGLQANAQKDPTIKAALAETQSRIHAVALVHQRLYVSGEVKEVALDEYLRAVLDQFQSTIGNAGKLVLRYDLEPLLLRTDASVNLGIIAAEWVMNAAKYAYPDASGEVRVKLAAAPEGKAMFTVEDDGVGRGDGVTQGTGLGSKIVNAMARSLLGTVEYSERRPGFSARLEFSLVGV
jgi:two-component sensor histidine kinase